MAPPAASRPPRASDVRGSPLLRTPAAVLLRACCCRGRAAALSACTSAEDCLGSSRATLRAACPSSSLLLPEAEVEGVSGASAWDALGRWTYGLWSVGQSTVVVFFSFSGPGRLASFIPPLPLPPSQHAIWYPSCISSHHHCFLLSRIASHSPSLVSYLTRLSSRANRPAAPC